MADKKNVIRELLENGKRNGSLSSKEINDALEECNLEPDQLEKLYETLAGLGIEIEEEAGHTKVR